MRCLDGLFIGTCANSGVITERSLNLNLNVALSAL
jgi:hypothetical protein